MAARLLVTSSETAMLTSRMEDAMTTKRVLSALTGLLFLGMATVAAAQAPTGEMMGKHTMDGQVTKVDAKKGWVDVKTPEGSMKLHFPAPAKTK